MAYYVSKKTSIGLGGKPYKSLSAGEEIPSAVIEKWKKEGTFEKFLTKGIIQEAAIAPVVTEEGQPNLIEKKYKGSKENKGIVKDEVQ